MKPTRVENVKNTCAENEKKTFQMENVKKMATILLLMNMYALQVLLFPSSHWAKHSMQMAGK